jgi:hypothetical protein
MEIAEGKVEEKQFSAFWKLRNEELAIADS